MPIIPKQQTLPAWADPAGASVTDPYAVKVIRKLVDLSGLGTPEGQVLTAAMPAPLVSIYKTPLQRAAMTADFRQRARLIGERFSKPYEEALSRFADKYPRIAAHLMPMVKDDPNLPYHGQIGLQEGKATARMPLTISRTGIDEALADPREAVQTVFHEGTHAAQGLGNSDATKLYDLSTILGGGGNTGYHGNAFEIPAEQRAFDEGFGQKTRHPLSAIQLLVDQMNSSVQRNPGDAEIFDAADSVRRILEYRNRIGWSPSR